MFCEGFINDEGKPSFKFSGICDNPSISVQDETLFFFELKSILKLLIVKDVLPPKVPIRNIRNFENLCKYFIFPFLLITAEAKTPGVDKERTFNNSNAGESVNNSQAFS